MDRTLTGWAVLAVVTMASGCAGPFQGSTKVTLRQTVPDEGVKQVALTEPGAIRRMTDTISLMPKLPCECKHYDSAVFETRRGTIQVSLCDHCFDFNGITYHMPPDFYMLFMSHMASAPLTPTPAASQPKAMPTTRPDR